MSSLCCYSLMLISGLACAVTNNNNNNGGGTNNNNNNNNGGGKLSCTLCKAPLIGTLLMPDKPWSPIHKRSAQQGQKVFFYPLQPFCRWDHHQQQQQWKVSSWLLVSPHV